jgi:hypothetical protein
MIATACLHAHRGKSNCDLIENDAVMRLFLSLLHFVVVFTVAVNGGGYPRVKTIARCSVYSNTFKKFHLQPREPDSIKWPDLI